MEGVLNVCDTRLLDYIIVTDSGYLSYADEGRIL